MDDASAAQPDPEHPSALYRQDGELFVPSIATRGPWSPDAQHGGPVAALMCREAERVDAAGAMAVVRLTVELLKPVPLAPLTVRARLRRPGRRVQLVELVVLQGETEVALATALRIRLDAVPVTDAVPLPGRSPDGSPPPRPPSDDVASFADDRWPWVDTIGMDLRFVDGSLWEPGPATAWFRMRMPLVEGESPSPAQRVMVAADSGSGVGAALDFSRYRFLNPEITIHLARRPVGEWIAVQAGTMLSDEGTGVTTSRLWDLDGVVGQSSAALFVEAGS